MTKRQMWTVMLIGAGLLLASCASETGNVVEVDLTAEVVDWTVVEGEVVEVWGYNGLYPGPLIEAVVGDTIRVNLKNELPEGTTIHWHGLEVPNEQDGVPGITQPLVEPGQTWTYEFTVDKPGTTMYHTHANTVKQLGRGLVGPLVVRDKAPRNASKYDSEFTLVLHEIDGLYTINGHSFPATLAEDDSLLTINEGETILARFINAGQQHHPMHLHGHQFKVVALDGNPVADPYSVNTIDIAPGQTVDLEIVGDNPGTWTFHCHILPHVTNRGVYPGGMLTVLDYADHTSFFEGAPAPAQPQGAAPATVPPAAPDTTTAAVPDLDVPADAARPVDGVVEVASTEFAFDPAPIAVAPGEEVTIRLTNDGVVEHNIEIGGLGVFVVAQPGETTEVTFTAPEESGVFEYVCNIAGHREAGMVGTLYVAPG